MTKDTITDTVVNAKQCNVEMGKEYERGTRISLTIRVVPNLRPKTVDSVSASGFVSEQSNGRDSDSVDSQSHSDAYS